MFTEYPVLLQFPAGTASSGGYGNGRMPPHYVTNTALSQFQNTAVSFMAMRAIEMK